MSETPNPDLLIEFLKRLAKINEPRPVITARGLAIERIKAELEKMGIRPEELQEPVERQTA